METHMRRWSEDNRLLIRVTVTEHMAQHFHCLENTRKRLLPYIVKHVCKNLQSSTAYKVKI